MRGPCSDAAGRERSDGASPCCFIPPPAHLRLVSLGCLQLLFKLRHRRLQLRQLLALGRCQLGEGGGKGEGKTRAESGALGRQAGVRQQERGELEERRPGCTPFLYVFRFGLQPSPAPPASPHLRQHIGLELIPCRRQLAGQVGHGLLRSGKGASGVGVECEGGPRGRPSPNAQCPALHLQPHSAARASWLVSSLHCTSASASCSSARLRALRWPASPDCAPRASRRACKRIEGAGGLGGGGKGWWKGQQRLGDPQKAGGSAGGAGVKHHRPGLAEPQRSAAARHQQLPS
jgi:hypothetical protein